MCCDAQTLANLRSGLMLGGRQQTCESAPAPHEGVSGASRQGVLPPAWTCHTRGSVEASHWESTHPWEPYCHLLQLANILTRLHIHSHTRNRPRKVSSISFLGGSQTESRTSRHSCRVGSAQSSEKPVVLVLLGVRNLHRADLIRK